MDASQVEHMRLGLCSPMILGQAMQAAQGTCFKLVAVIPPLSPDGLIKITPFAARRKKTSREQVLPVAS